MSASWEVLEGDCREVLATLPDQSVHAVVTSPPYFGLRDYGTATWVGGDPECEHREGRQTSRLTPATKNGAASTDVTRWSVCGVCGAERVDQQIGAEPTPQEFVDALVAVFREVRRVLRDDGTVWLNLGDSYATRWSSIRTDGGRAGLGPGEDRARHHAAPAGFKSKDLMGIPWMVAFALRADGWYLRADIVWAKPNPMPESVSDRPTRSHEYVFLLTKSPRYYYDADAIREPHTMRPQARPAGRPIDETPRQGQPRQAWSTAARDEVGVDGNPAGRNKRDVWTVDEEEWAQFQAWKAEHAGERRDVWSVSTKPYRGAHFATFPPDLIEPCVLAGAPERACSACGAPWARQARTEVDDSRPPARQRAEIPEVSLNGDGRNGRDSATFGQWTRRVTLGFEPSCTCEADTKPGVVLDPFAGAGTTGMVALRHGRSFVGVELNPEYAEMARGRIRDDAPLLNGPAEVVRPEVTQAA